MYLPPPPANTLAVVPGTSATAPIRLQWFADYIRVALWWSWTSFMQLMGAIRSLIVCFLSAFQSWLSSLKPHLSSVWKFVSFPLDWPTYTLNVATYTIKNYPHFIHITAWLIFFGPLAILCPLLLLYEASIAIAFNAIFIFHGLIPGTLEKNYVELRDATDDARQMMFVYVEQATNTYNKWTVESNPLLIFRLFAGATGIYILYSIWFS